MNSTLVYDETRPTVKRKAVSYARVGEEYKEIDYTPLNLIYGDGNVNSTAEDLYKWDQALNTERLLRAGTLEQAFTPSKLNDGTETGYGSGWLVKNSPGLRRIAHGGSWVGFRSLLVRYPDQRLTVIVLSNFAEFDRETAAYKIAKIYLADQMVLPSAVYIKPEALRKYVGRYLLCEWVPAGATDCEGRFDSGAYFDVTLEGEALWVKPSNRENARLDSRIGGAVLCRRRGRRALHFQQDCPRRCHQPYKMAVCGAGCAASAVSDTGEGVCPTPKCRAIPRRGTRALASLLGFGHSVDHAVPVGRRLTAARWG